MKKLLPILLLSIFSISACAKNDNPITVEQNTVSDVSSVKKNDALDKAYKSLIKYILKVSDKNNDGKLSVNELGNNNAIYFPKEKLEAFFKEFDSDKDGLLSIIELMNGYRNSKDVYMNESGFENQASDIIKRLDKNNDGILSYSEADQMFNWTPPNAPSSTGDFYKSRYILINADINRDGKLDKNELKNLSALQVETYYELAYESTLNPAPAPNPQPSVNPNLGSILKPTTK